MCQAFKLYIQQHLSLSTEEVELISAYGKIVELQKKAYLLRSGEVCNFIAFVESGTIRHFHFKEGIAKTCDISLETAWVTDFQSFLNQMPSKITLQAVENTTLIVLPKSALLKLYHKHPKYEGLGRLIAEEIAQRLSEIAMSLASEKPEERFQKLLKKQAAIFQRVPQKYIASFLGISPESLSRIKGRISKSPNR